MASECTCAADGTLLGKKMRKGEGEGKGKGRGKSACTTNTHRHAYITVTVAQSEICLKNTQTRGANGGTLDAQHCHSTAMTNLQRYWLSPFPFPQPPSDALQLSISPRRENRYWQAGGACVCSRNEYLSSILLAARALHIDFLCRECQCYCYCCFWCSGIQQICNATTPRLWEKSHHVQHR
jgi:hypothetical protein